MDHVLEEITQKLSLVTHSKIGVFRLAKEFPFDTCIDGIICVAKFRAIQSSMKKSKFVGRHGL